MWTVDADEQCPDAWTGTQSCAWLGKTKKQVGRPDRADRADRVL